MNFILYIIINASRKNAGMAELADALDLESSSQGVQVRFLLPAPDLMNLPPFIGQNMLQ